MYIFNVLPKHPMEIKCSQMIQASVVSDIWNREHCSWYVRKYVAFSWWLNYFILNLLLHRRGNIEKTGGFDSQRSHSGRDSLPDAAIGFDNSLYFEANNPDKVRGLPEIPKQNGHTNGHQNGRRQW